MDPINFKTLKCVSILPQIITGWVYDFQLSLTVTIRVGIRVWGFVVVLSSCYGITPELPSLQINVEDILEEGRQVTEY